MAELTRRDFFKSAGMSVFGGAVIVTHLKGMSAAEMGAVHSCGPAANYITRISAAVVRRREEYGMLWPGAVYDGEKARENYTRQLRAAAQRLGIALELRPEPIYSLEEADAWVAAGVAQQADGLLLIVLDRQQHAWPTVYKAAGSGIPTVAFSPLGTSFTTNTAPLAAQPGVFLACTDDFSQAEWGLKMLRAKAKMREMRFLVFAGDRRHDEREEHFGTRLRYLPKIDFVEEYRKSAESDEIKRMAADYIAGATEIREATRQDVINGIKSFVVARRLLEREEGDGITMDCLGALGREEISLPCISWSRMNDCGVPAACEADIEACLTHALVQYLFDRPGFQQDPVPETARNLLIGSHCSCPTRMRGFNQPAETYFISHHHGGRDAVPRTVWQPGTRATVADIQLREGERPQMVISVGSVVENRAVPPAGGCVVAVSLKLDNSPDMLSYPGFHQLFFYGDYKRELTDFCKLANVEPLVV